MGRFIRKGTLLALIVALAAFLLGGCFLVQRGEEVRAFSLSLPPDVDSVDTKGVWLLQPVFLPQGTFALAVEARAFPPGPLWVSLTPSLPETCAPLPGGELVACAEAPPLTVLLADGRGAFEIREGLTEARFLYVGLGWVEGAVWSGDVEVVVRYEAF